MFFYKTFSLTIRTVVRYTSGSTPGGQVLSKFTNQLLCIRYLGAHLANTPPIKHIAAIYYPFITDALYLLVLAL